jgi:hypothetical protein
MTLRCAMWNEYSYFSVYFGGNERWTDTMSDQDTDGRLCYI